MGMSRGRQVNVGGSSREEKLMLESQSNCCFEEAAEGRLEQREAQKPWAKLSFDGIHLSWGSS